MQTVAVDMVGTASFALMIGIPLGVVLHRSGFCLHSGFRQALRGEGSPAFLAYLLALAVQMVLVNGLAAGKVISVPNIPLSLAPAIFGGLFFGFGMVWAKG